MNTEGGIPQGKADAKALMNFENNLLASIFVLDQKGCSIRMIASELNISKSKVHRVLRRAKARQYLFLSNLNINFKDSKRSLQ